MLHGALAKLRLKLRKLQLKIFICFAVAYCQKQLNFYSH